MLYRDIREFIDNLEKEKGDMMRTFFCLVSGVLFVMFSFTFAIAGNLSPDYI